MKCSVGKKLQIFLSGVQLFQNSGWFTNELFISHRNLTIYSKGDNSTNLSNIENNVQYGGPEGF
jgi:hypothetical protein